MKIIEAKIFNKEHCIKEVVVYDPDDFVHYSLYYQRAGDASSLLRHQSDGILSWFIGDVNENEKPDILIHDGYSGSGGFGTLTMYEFFDNSLKIIFERSEVEGTYVFLDRYPGDMRDELLFFYKVRKWDVDFHEAIYRWDEEKSIYNLFYDSLFKALW